MTTRVNIDHNIPDVVDSVEDVKQDIPAELEKRVGAAMRVLWADVKQYVLNDPNTRGWLFQSIDHDQEIGDEELRFTVFSGGRVTDYAGIVEFGSGRKGKSGEIWPSAANPHGPPDRYPPDYPYDSPSVDYPETDSEMIRAWTSTHDNRYNTFFALARIIERWMSRKGLVSHVGDNSVSAMFITREIIRNGTYAHPYMRPAWFDNELDIKKAAINAVRNAAR